MYKRRKPRKLNCVILNAPETPAEQQNYDEKVVKSLAKAIYRSLEPDELDTFITQLKNSAS